LWLIDALLTDFECSSLNYSGQSYGQHYDFMQMRYSYQLLGMYSFAFISECGFCRCVVLPYEGSTVLHAF